MPYACPDGMRRAWKRRKEGRKQCVRALRIGNSVKHRMIYDWDILCSPQA
jgi:hypothetical protein